VPDESLRSYKITYCRDYGSVCGKCPFADKCTGCEIPDNDELLNTDIKFAIGIDWEEEHVEKILEYQTKRVCVGGYDSKHIAQAGLLTHH
jgi:hypothetical protein